MGCLISVVIPTFNRKKFLKRSIGSILNQDYEHTEIIVVDDFSTDGTEEFVRKLSKYNKNLRYLKNERLKGASGARNTGILSSNGCYICFLDSDDEFKKNHISVRLNFINKNKVDLVFGDYDIIDDQKAAFINSFFQYKESIKIIQKKSVENGFLLEEKICNYLVMENFFSLGTLMVDSTLAKKNLLREDVSYAEDRDFAIRIGFDNETKIGCINISTYIAHKHGSNMTYDNYENDLKKWSDLLKLYDGYLKSSMFKKNDHKIIIKQIKEVYRSQIICQRKHEKFKDSFKSLYESLKYKVGFKDLNELYKCCFHPLLKSVIKKRKGIVL